MIEVHDHEFDSLCLYAFRYAKERSSYAVADMCDIVSKHIDSISKNTLKIIFKELTQELIDRNHSKHSFECDERALRKLHDQIEDELNDNNSRRGI